MVEKFSNKTLIRSHQTLGDLFINFNHDSITDYKRSLNLNKAIAETHYKTDGYPVSQSVFASAADQVIVIAIKSAHPKGLNGTLTLQRPQDEGIPTVTSYITEGDLIMEGEITQRKGKFNSKPAPINEGIRFQTRLKTKHNGGTINASNKTITVTGVQELELYLVSNSSYYHKDYQKQNLQQLEALRSKNLTLFICCIPCSGWNQ